MSAFVYPKAPDIKIVRRSCRGLLPLAIVTICANGLVEKRSLANDTSPDKSSFTLFNPTPEAELRSFSTDRPPEANSPFTVDAGHFQYETDLSFFGTEYTEGVRTRQWTVLDPTFKLGLTNAIDVEAQITPYELIASRSALGLTSASGIGDTIARVKVNLVGNDKGGVSVALLPYMKLPTAPHSLGNRAVEGGMIAPVTVNGPAGFTITVMPEGDYVKNAGEKGYHTAIDLLVNVNHSIGNRWSLYSEVFTSQPLKANAAAMYTWDEALTFLVTPTLQLDFGGNFALNKVAPKRQLYAGLSQRF